MIVTRRLLSSVGVAVTVSIFALSSGLLYGDSPEAVDLMQVYQLAVKNDTQLAAAQASFKAAEEARPQSRAALLPTIGLSAQVARNKRSDPQPAGVGNHASNWDSRGWGASLIQPLFNLQSWFAFERAGYLTSQAERKLAVEQQGLILRVAEAYFNVLLAEESLATSVVQQNALQRQLEQTQQRFEVGLIAETDVLEARAAYDGSRVTRIQAGNQVSVAYENLGVLTNTPIAQLKSLDRTMPVLGPTPDAREEWVQTAVAQNLALQVSRSGLDIANAQLKESRSGHLPTLNATANYDALTNRGEGPPDGTSKATVFAVQLSVPIFSGGATQSKVRQAGYQLEQAQMKFDQSLRTVRANTRNLFNTVKADGERISARCRAIESSKSALKATESGYEVGTRNIVDVLNARQRLHSAQQDYLSARYDFIINTLKLKQSAGTLSPQDLKDLNSWMSTNVNNDQDFICTQI